MLTDNVIHFPDREVFAEENDWLELGENFRVANLDEFLCDLCAMDNNGFTVAFANTIHMLESYTAESVLDELKNTHNCKKFYSRFIGRVEEIEEMAVSFGWDPSAVRQRKA